MIDRHQYVEKLKAKLDEWDRDLDVFESRLKDTTEEIRQRSQQALADLKTTRDQITRNVDDAKTTSDEAWQKVRLNLDRAWESVKTGLLNARAELMPPAGPDEKGGNKPS